MAARRLSLKMFLGACILIRSFTVEAQVPRANGPTNHSNVPNLFTPDGKLTHEAFHFTTKAYEREALKRILEEANKVAAELHLPEKLPITETNLTRAFILGYGMSYLPPGMIGNVHTRDYGYFVSVGHKLSYVEGAHQDQDCMKWRQQYRWPVSRIDTNEAYQLATEWLVEAHMDVQGLNRDCEVHVVLDRYWNNPKLDTETFVPIYEVYWLTPLNKTTGYGDVASVKLFAPTNTLISLRVEDSKYILRKPLVFTNLDYLLSQTNASTETTVQAKQ